MSGTPVSRRIEAVWRIEGPRLTASLARLIDDVPLAEDFAQDALEAALRQWPRSCVPDNPGAWLTAVAKRRAIDALRRTSRWRQATAEIARDLESTAPSAEPGLGDDIEDDLLRLIFVACHPVLSREGRAALTLRMLGGLTTREIARAFLVPEATVAQRIVRAKRTLAAQRVRYEVPEPEERPARVSSVLEVVYLIFNEGYSATGGEQWVRPPLCDEALRLGRLLAALTPEESEAFGLLSLMELQASRLGARVGPDGQLVLLPYQDRARWDRGQIRRGLAALDRAQSLGGGAGPYALQAAIAACHAVAPTDDDTDWYRIAGLYDVLAHVHPSPVVELNRAVAHSRASGPEAGLAIVEALRYEPSLRNYHLLPSVRADLLARLGRYAEARRDLEHAARLTANARERELLLHRATELPATP